MVIFKPDDPPPDPKRRRPDATNYLGSIRDLLEDKLPREAMRPGALITYRHWRRVPYRHQRHIKRRHSGAWASPRTVFSTASWASA